MRNILASLALAACLCACQQAPMHEDRAQRAGERAIEVACHREGYYPHQVARAMDYIEFVRREAEAGELSRYIRPEIWRPCVATERESTVSGRMSQLLYEKGTEMEMREDLLSLQYPPGFCEMAPAVYGPVAAPRITAVCANLGIEAPR